MIAKEICVFSAALALAACGGNGGETPVETPYDEMVGAFSQSERHFGSYAVTPLDDVPQGIDAGTAIYSGYAVFSLANAPISNIASQIQIEIDFATTSLSGFAHHFYSDDGSALTVVDDMHVPQEQNQMPFTGGYDLSNRPDYPINFDLTGNLLASDGMSVRLDLSMDGDFIGADAGAITGIAGGQATFADGPATHVVGDFVAVN